ncbi:MAG: peptide chain release factor N(5)-glutamine methyltransferase [Candidatus Babeliales bacterium]
MKQPIHALVATITKKLETEYHDLMLAQQTAWWLLEALTKLTQAQLIVQQELELSKEQEQQLAAWVTEITTKHKPLQYILGSVPFANLEILVKPPILIPRPETEEFVLNLIDQLKAFKNEKLSILDVGTGTGCIALALAKALPHATITGIDIDSRALALARTNAQHNNIHNVVLSESDVYANLGTYQTFDLIVSNPPYIAPEEWQALEPSVTQWENPGALLAPHEGLAIIERIIKDAPTHLKRDSALHKNRMAQLIIEIGYMQGPAIKQLMEQHEFTRVEIKKDLEGKDRTVWGYL